MKFSSELFKANMINTENARYISSDFSYLLPVESETIDLLVKAITSVDLDSDNSYFTKLLIDEKYTKSTAECVVRAFRFIVSLTLDEAGENDDANDWADDFITLNILEENQKESFVEIVNRIKKDITPEFKTKARVNIAENGWMPNFISVNTTTEVRAVNNNKFTNGDDILEYDADIIDVVGVMSIRIRVDEGDPSVFHFQAGRKDVKNLIDKLKASLIELDALERFIKE